MKKKTPRESLKSLSTTYIFLAILGVIFACVINFIPSVADAFKQASGNENILFEANVKIVVDIIIYIWYFWLARRVADGTSDGTVYMVLLILGVVGAIISAVMGSTKAISSIDFAVDAAALYFLLKVRKEN